MRKLKLFAVVGMLIVLLTSCGSPSLVGHWERDSQGLSELEFFSDGTYTSSDSNHFGTYSVDGDRVRLSGVLVSDWTYNFKVSGDTLTLRREGGDPLEFTKVKDE